MANRRKFASPWDEIEHRYARAACWLRSGRPRRATPHLRRLKILIARRRAGEAPLCVLEARDLLAEREGDPRRQLEAKRRLVDFLLQLMDVATDVPGYEPPVVLMEMQSLALLLEGNGRRSEARRVAGKCRAFAKKHGLAIREGAARKLYGVSIARRATPRHGL